LPGAILGVIVMGGAGFWVQRGRKREANPDTLARAVRWALWSVVAGLAGYILYGMGAPGSAVMRATFGIWTALIVVVICGAVPLAWGFRVSREALRFRSANRK
jgi:uncharacterized membrane protein